MRKRTINNIAKTIFWYTLYFLPVIAYLLFMLSEPATGGTGAIGLGQFLTTSNFFNDLTTNNIVFSSIADIFGSNGVFPIFLSDTIPYILTWFVTIKIVHLVIDFILFLPNLAHKWFNDFSEEQ